MATSVSTLANALIAVQKEMPPVDKTGRSNFGAHVTLDHLIAKTRPHLAKHGLAIAQFIEHNEAGQPTLRTTLMHESGESLTGVMPLLLTQANMQQLGSATTYARRYAWAAILGISSEADDDADSTMPAFGGPPASSGRPPASCTGTAPAPQFQAPTGPPTQEKLQLIKTLCGQLAALPNATMDAAAIEAALGPVLTKQKASEVCGKLQRKLESEKKRLEQAA
jgi:hypothetical protein